MTSPIPALSDFPDHLSPMVVKELRQGLRTRAFGSVMLGLHVLLVLVTLLSGAAANAEETAWMLDSLATLVLCLVLPLRVSAALADEVKHNTLDMLMLTRLSAGRIVFGKWASVACQSLLLAVSLMPYVVARYVFGGTDLFGELGALGLKWLAGIVFAAVVLCLSSIRQPWLRMFILAVPLFSGVVGIFGMAASSFGGGGFFSPSSSSAGIGVLEVLIILAVAVWAVFAFLSTAASRIAPPAAPLSALKRSVHLGAFLASLGIAWVTGEEGWFAGAVVVAIVAAVDALTERVNEVPSVYEPFYRRGPLGRLALWLLAPGWVTGFLLTLPMAALLTLAAALDSGWEEAVVTGLFCACFWMVAALVQMLPTRRSQDLLPVFIGTALVLYISTVMLTGFGFILSKGTDTPPWLLCAIPLTAIGGLTNSFSGNEEMIFSSLSLAAAAVWPLLLALMGAHAWRQLRPVREEARQLTA